MNLTRFRMCKKIFIKKDAFNNRISAGIRSCNCSNVCGQSKYMYSIFLNDLRKKNLKELNLANGVAT